MEEVIAALQKAGIRYVVIGGQAMRAEGLPRFTMDWDIFIPPHDQKNIDKINEVLDDLLDTPIIALGARGEHFVQTFQTPFGILEFHLLLPGIRFEEAEANAVFHEIGQFQLRFLSTEDLLKTKEATGREHDAEDIAFLIAKLEQRNEQDSGMRM